MTEDPKDKPDEILIIEDEENLGFSLSEDSEIYVDDKYKWPYYYDGGYKF
jgi:hypothetical protein